MNAKFEKWCEGEKYMVDRIKGAEGLTYYRTSTQNAWNGWKGAIQSLEVTPELEEVANKASDECWEYVRREDAVFCTEDEIRAILDAVLSALKEQAKCVLCVTTAAMARRWLLAVRCTRIDPTFTPRSSTSVSRVMR